MADTKVVVYKQTVVGLDVFEATMGMQVDQATMSLEAVQSSMHGSITLENPSSVNDDAERTLTKPALRKLLGIDLPKLGGGRVTRQVVYRYEPDQREETRAGEGCFTGSPSLPALPPTTIEGLAKGQHHVVDEVLFDAALNADQPAVHWRALVEPTSGDVLYLRPLVACATGLVYDRDPQTQSGAAVTAASTNAVLNPFRTSHTLADLAPATPQPLSGAFVAVQDIDRSGRRAARRGQPRRELRVRRPHRRLLCSQRVPQLRPTLPHDGGLRLHRHHLLQQHDLPGAGRPPRARRRDQRAWPRATRRAPVSAGCSSAG